MSNKNIFALSETFNVCDLWNIKFNEYNKIVPKQNNKKTDDDSSAISFCSPLHKDDLDIVKTYDEKFPPIVQTIDRTLNLDPKNYIFESKFKKTKFPPIN